MTRYKKLETSLRDVQELENFLFTLMPELVQRDMRDGDDVLAYAKKLGFSIPEMLEGETMTWDVEPYLATEAKDADLLILARPGIPGIIGLTIGCIKWRRFKICLECGWFYCRIVIKGVFAI